MVIMLIAEPHKAASNLLTIWHTWSSDVSLAIAVIAIIISIAQTRTAKKALQLSLLQDARRNARLDVNLKESVTWRPLDKACKYIGVRVLAVNPTDTQAALISAELRISYSLQSGKIIVLKISHETKKADLPKGLVALNLPAALSSNGALEGWLLFRLDDGLIGDGSIENYEVMIDDSRGISQSVHPWIMKEVAGYG